MRINNIIIEDEVMKMDLYEDLTYEELSKFKEIKELVIDKNSFKLSDGFCPECTQKMSKVIENKNLFDGAVTFHIIKYKCPKCNKEYLDLEQAEKLDFFLLIKKLSKKPLSTITQSINKLIVAMR